MGILISMIHFAARALFLLILAHVVLSYFLPPYHSVRIFLDRLVEPLLKPIRRLVPPIGMVDLSPLVLILLVQVVEYILVALLLNLA